MLVLVALMACKGGDTDSDVVYHPSLQFLAPADGSTVAAGDVHVSVVVDEFELVPPESASLPTGHAVLPTALWALEATAAAHNEEGTPAGYVELSLDGTVVTELSDTQYTLTGVTAGEHTLTGTLYYADGDELETPVVESVTFTAQ